MYALTSSQFCQGCNLFGLLFVTVKYQYNINVRKVHTVVSWFIALVREGLGPIQYLKIRSETRHIKKLRCLRRDVLEGAKKVNSARGRALYMWVDNVKSRNQARPELEHFTWVGIDPEEER